MFSVVTATQFLTIDNNNYLGLFPHILDDIQTEIILQKKLNYVEILKLPKLWKKKYYPTCLDNLKEPKIIIRRWGGVGDIIWTLFAAKKLKEKYSNLKITYCVLNKDRDLFKNVDYVDGLTENEIISLKEAYENDFILDFFYSVEGNKEAEYLDPYEISYKWAFGKELDQNVDVTGLLKTNEKDDVYTKELIKNKKYILVNMQSSSPKRTYFFTEILLKKLNEKINDYLIVNAGVRPENIFENEKIINVVNKTNINQYISLVKNASYVICVDSATLHIAQQFNVPTLCLFSTVPCETRIKFYKKVFAIQSELPCSPCYQLSEKCNIENECLKLHPEKIIEKFLELKKCIQV